MADRESTAVGYRLRLEPPGGLSTYPDAVKLMWHQWVVDFGLARKDRELAQGKDKDGVVGVLSPQTIKHRKSEVGPTTAHAPFLTPSYARSRVRSLLTGRAHTSSAEFWWSFDAVSGRSFAAILHHQAENGHDVFGLSPAGTAWVTREASKRWAGWLAEGHHGRPAVSPVGTPIRKVAVLKPVAKVPIGRTDLVNMTGGAGARDAVTLAAIEAAEHTGFRRLNLEGEKWQPWTTQRRPVAGPAFELAVEKALGQLQPAQYRRVPGPTPHGGAYALVRMAADGSVSITEYDRTGRVVKRAG